MNGFFSPLFLPVLSSEGKTCCDLFTLKNDGHTPFWSGCHGTQSSQKLPDMQCFALLSPVTLLWTK